jgi:adenylate cyclase
MSLPRTFKIFLLVFFLAAAARSQNNPSPAVRLTHDSITNAYYYLDEGWKYVNADDPSMASPSYDDSGWKNVKPTLEYSDAAVPDFRGCGWFRLRFSIDSSLVMKPLALEISHLGASEIFVDGKKIKSFGKIQGPVNSRYYDPSEIPFTVVLADTGLHLIAVRYANYQSEKNFRTYLKTMAGFRMTIGIADRQIARRDQRSIIITFTVMLLCGIFSALSLIHFLMFMYHKSARSNLYFSLFMLSLALVFLFGFIGYASTTPGLVMKCSYLLQPVLVIGAVALSGFITELFAKKRTLLLIIFSMGVATIFMRIFSIQLFGQATMALIISVAFQVVFTTIFAIIRKIKGARIIGFGILFFCLFLLTLFAIGIVQGGSFDLDDSTMGGRIFIAFMGLAIISIPASMSVYLAWSFSFINKTLAVQLDNVKNLSQKSLQQEQEKQRLLETKQEELEKEVWDRTAELREEKQKADDLLLNILPAEVASELKEKGRTSAKTYSQVTVMFTDFKDFTDASEKISAELLVSEIDHCFSAFDNIIQKYKIEKIKTIGDAYLCAGGLPVLSYSHAEDTVRAAMEIRDFMSRRKKEKQEKGEQPFEIRIGLHTGPVVAGIVGIKKFAYDIWGDTVNMAARMEQNGESGKINISGATYELVKTKFNCIHRGKIEAKNKGEVDMYFVE